MVGAGSGVVRVAVSWTSHRHPLRLEVHVIVKVVGGLMLVVRLKWREYIGNGRLACPFVKTSWRYRWWVVVWVVGFVAWF